MPPLKICPQTTDELVTSILDFCEMLSGRAFYRFQRAALTRIITLLLETPPEDFILSSDDYEPATVTELCSRQSGKSTGLADVGSGLCVILPELAKTFPNDMRLAQFKDGFFFGVFAPKQEKSQIVYGKLRDICESERAGDVYEELGIKVTAARGDEFRWTNGSYATAKTASETSDKEGFTYHLIIIDEAQLVSATKVRKELRPMLAATNGKLVLIGTPSLHQNAGFFKSTIKENLEYEKNTGVKNHFEYDYLKVIYDKREQFKIDRNPFHLNYERFIQREVKDLGYDSDEFCMNYRLKWVALTGKVFDMEHFKKLGLQTVEAGPSREGFQIAAMDVAKDGGARSVVCVGKIHMDAPTVVSDHNEAKYVKQLVNWLPLTGRFEGATGQYARVVEFLMEHNVHYFLIDATGIGDPVFERFEWILRPKGIIVIPYKHSVVSNDLLNKLYIREVTSRRFFYPAGPETQKTEEYELFIEEHDGIIKGYSGNYLQFFTSYDTKDFVISAALLCHGADLIFKDPALRTHIPENNTLESTVSIPYSSLAELSTSQDDRPKFRPAMPYFDAGRYLRHIPHNAGQGLRNAQGLNRPEPSEALRSRRYKRSRGR